ncbi:MULTISPECIES: WD40/YVTN/BNR-like repeat-containing protein [Haloprofundus]|uniref:WD40/YVTN/BNR-like repeat-containing protein n=1 Tax=Haloprofundus TaxID=1911573 RepID=UPI000E42EE49|nr:MULTISPECIES: hypothetical protein [Haloprofundus]QCJ47199.1 hypothetical protein FCF25_08745 [Haloprofundus sp. MHR1]
MTTQYAALRNVLLVVRGGPGEWLVDKRLADHDIECVAAVPDGRVAFCGTFDAGLWRTDTEGQTWHRVGDETLTDPVMAVAVDPTDPERVWAGTEPSAVYRSTDGGDTWEQCEGLTDLPSAEEWSFPPRPDTHHVRWIEIDPSNADHLYVGIEAGALVQTRDGGETWEDRVPSARRDNHSLTTHPDAPDRVWSAAGDGYAESDDGGETWDHPQEGLDHRYCWSVAVGREARNVLVSAASGARSAHNADAAESYVYRRRKGENWTRLDGLPTGKGVTRPVLATDDNGSFYALSNRGLFRSQNSGKSWNRVDIPWPEAYETQTARGLAVITEP